MKHSQPEYDRHISAIPLPWQEEYRERVAIILADELEVSEVVLEDARRRAYEMTKASMDEHWRKSSHST